MLIRALRVLSVIAAIVLAMGSFGVGRCVAQQTSFSQKKEALLGGQAFQTSQSAVALISDDTGQCSGVLVGQSTVLTAAHCVVGIKLARTVVVLGGEAHTVKEGYYHSFYNPNSPVVDSNQRYDLGVLILDKPPTTVLAIPIAYSDSVRRGESFSVYGFGLNEVSDVSTANGALDFARIATFVTRYVDSGVIHTEQYSSGSSVCVGDSGGPGIQVFGATPGVIGTVSYGTNGELFGKCTLGAGSSGLVDLQSRSSLAFLRLFPDIRFFSAPLARFAEAINQVRSQLEASLSASLQAGNLQLLRSGAVEARSRLKAARRIVSSRTRRQLVDRASRRLRSVSKADSISEAAPLAAEASNSLDQLLALGIN